MPGSSSDPSHEAPSPDNWDRDAWKDDDAWARDDWKNADWGEPAAPPMKPRAGSQRGGMASYRHGMTEAGPYLTLGMQIAFGMMLFVGIGYVVDQWLESTPWGMILGAVLGMVAVFTLVIRMAREADAKQKAKRQKSEGSEG